MAIVAVGSLGAVLLPSAEARGEGAARAALDGLVIVDGDSVAGGGALGLGLGYDFELSPLLLEPEIRGSFGYEGGDFSGWWIRALTGLRVGFAGPVEPCAFVRLGYGNTLVTRGDASSAESGFALQPGAAVAYRPERWLTVGAEAFYDLFVFSTQSVTDTMHSVGAGATLAFWF
ncbi:MAG: hypothetical protein JRI23_20165 [Deltaproteobacteria bacterium]|jgi:hypothetical protein|nr:hypothetical protein [Deltaproteobacteria bacterium]MBW2534191.1 hypothetical protein [Deltaproteobacteria bacterium]